MIAKLKLKKRLGVNNLIVKKEIIKPGVEYSFDLSMKEIKSDFINHWFDIEIPKKTKKVSKKAD